MVITGTPAHPSLEKNEETATSSGVLIEQWRSGDREAFRTVIQQFQGPLLSYVFHRIHNIQDAEDAVQETFLRAHKSIRQLRDGEKVWAWLKQIAHNTAMDYVRHAQRRGIPTEPSLIQEMGDERQSLEGHDTHAPEPDTQDLSMEMIVDAIEDLPLLYRQVAVYHFLQEWPYTRIADTLVLEPATVRQRISRACKMLRTTLAKQKRPGGSNV